MAVTTDILRSWRRPGTVVTEHLARGPREDRVLVFLMVACLILFIARWPALARQAQETGEEIDRLISYTLFGALMLLPLLLYGLAFLGYLLGRPFLAGLTPFGGRLALSWAMLAASPAAILYGLVAGLIGPGVQATLTGALWAGAVLVFWIAGLRAAGRRP